MACSRYATAKALIPAGSHSATLFDVCDSLGSRYATPQSPYLPVVPDMPRSPITKKVRDMPRNHAPSHPRFTICHTAKLYFPAVPDMPRNHSPYTH